MLCTRCGQDVSVLADACPHCHADLRLVGHFTPWVEAGATPPVRDDGVSSGCPSDPAAHVPAGFDIARDLKALVARVSPAVVTIRARMMHDGDEGTSFGSGFVLSGTALVVTNRHVVEGGTDVTIVVQDGRGTRARVRQLAASVDLALLEPGARLRAGVPLGDSDAVAPGEFIIVVGNPLGRHPASVTTGVISAVRPLDGGGALFQLDASISPGSSGGPVFNVRGEVIAVIVATAADERAQNINFAIPSAEVAALLRR